MNTPDMLSSQQKSVSSPPSSRGMMNNLNLQSALHFNEVQYIYLFYNCRSLSSPNEVFPHIKSPRIMTIYQLRQKRHMSEPFFKSSSYHCAVPPEEPKLIESSNTDCWVCRCSQLNNNFTVKCTKCGYRKSLLEHKANNTILPHLSPTLTSFKPTHSSKGKETSDITSIASLSVQSNKIKINKPNRVCDSSSSSSSSSSDDILCDLNDIGVEEFNKYRSKSLPAYSLEFPDRFIRTFGGIKQQEDKPIKLQISLQPPKAIEKHDSIVVDVFKENVSFYSKKSNDSFSTKSNVNLFTSISPPLRINSSHKQSIIFPQPPPPVPVFNDSLNCPLKLKVNNVTTI